MATITSVNNTTAGATYNIHDPATWIGGVVPGPADTAVFQSGTATTWYLTQSWTIRGIQWSVSTNRSDSGIEVPDTVSQNVTLTQTVTSWAGGETPMAANGGEIAARTKPWLTVKNPAGTTFTLNLPGDLYFSNGSGDIGCVDRTLIQVSANGNCYINVTGLIMGMQYYTTSNCWSRRSAIYVTAGSGYTEINCALVRGGYNTYCCHDSAYNSAAIWVGPLTGTGSARINCTTIEANLSNGNYRGRNGPAIITSGDIRNGLYVYCQRLMWQRGNYGNMWLQHTNGDVTIESTNTITPSTNSSETWTVGYNEDYRDGPGMRRMIYMSGNSITARLIIKAEVHGPNSAYSTQVSDANWAIVQSGAGRIDLYGDVRTSRIYRYQIPFYTDGQYSLFYHMSGTAYGGVNSIYYNNNLATNTMYHPLVNQGGAGFYFANVVMEDDQANLIYPANRTPFLTHYVGPNPNYTGGGQIQWVYKRSTADRTAVSFIHADYTGYSPAPANVRLGTVYGGGTKTGTLAVPQPFQVAYGIATDNTVGTWTGVTNVVDVNAIADVIWNYNLGNITNTTTGAGKRLTNTATIESTGQQIAALGV